jgi:sec-independent protein translocase protein TatA
VGSSDKVPGMSLGVGELVVLVFVLVVVFSASRMGQLGNALGKFVYSFKKASTGGGFVDAGRGSSRLDAPGQKKPAEPEDAELVDPDKK